MKHRVFAYCGVFSSLDDLRVALTTHVLFSEDAPRATNLDWMGLLTFSPVENDVWVVTSYLHRPTAYPSAFWKELNRLDPVVSMISVTPGEELIHRGTDEARKYMRIGMDSVAVGGLSVSYAFEQLKGDLL